MANALRLCLICNEYPPSRHGGIGTVTRELAQGLAGLGWQVTVLGVYSPHVLEVKNVQTEWQDGVKVIRIPAASAGIPPQAGYLFDRLKLLSELKREHRQNPFNLIEVPDYEGMLPWGGLKGVPVVLRGHGSANYFDAELKKHRASRMIYYFERQTLLKADHLVFVSKYTATKELKIAGVHRDFSVVYNAVDMEFFSPDRDEAIEKGMVLFVNSINPKKGVEPLLLGMNHVFERSPQAKIRLLGKCPDDSYLEKLRGLVRDEFRNRAEFLGHMSRGDVLEQMRRANVCVFPSFSEAFAMGPLEAMAVEKPVIFTRLASGPETLEDGISGLLCDPYDPDDIAEKILTVLSDDELAGHLGANARERVNVSFDKKNWLPQNIALYQSLLA